MQLHEAYLKSLEYLQKYLKGKQASQMRHNKLFETIGLFVCWHIFTLKQVSRIFIKLQNLKLIFKYRSSLQDCYRFQRHSS